MLTTRHNRQQILHGLFIWTNVMLCGGNTSTTTKSLNSCVDSFPFERLSLVLICLSEARTPENEWTITKMYQPSKMWLWRLWLFQMLPSLEVKRSQRAFRRPHTSPSMSSYLSQNCNPKGVLFIFRDSKWKSFWSYLLFLMTQPEASKISSGISNSVPNS